MSALELHAEIAARAAAMPPIVIDDSTFAAVRAATATMFGGDPVSTDTVERLDHVVHEDPRVVVRVHRPRGLQGPAACLFSIHGGGYVLGSHAMDDSLLEAFVNEFGCVCVSVEYRLAPDSPYPGPLDDCLAGLEWTVAHANDLGVDPDRIGLMGVSAGGGLAAALSLLARDRGGPRIASLLLQCPMLDDRQITESSRADGLIGWSRGANTFGWRCYLGAQYGRADVPAYAAPARAGDADLVGLPPTMVIAGSADGFRDEDIDYALRLTRAGVPTDLVVVAGAPHGCVELFDGTEPARRWSHAVREWLRPRLDSRSS
ncbi:MAG TPA: alpha/beta hydrolase [Acidimicrobiia bacterium]|jgi:acetyl esterase/lipase|nr:alpha/beta hydrolase [Acidimicrobiia bacterium]